MVSLKHAYSVLLPVWGEGAMPWLTPMVVAPDTELVIHQNERLLIHIIFVVIDNERKIPQHNLAKFSPIPIVLPVPCGSLEILANVCWTPPLFSGPYLSLWSWYWDTRGGIWKGTDTPINPRAIASLRQYSELCVHNLSYIQ